MIDEIILLKIGIKLPPIIRKRGRPKGHECTVIGLPFKKSKTDCNKDGRIKPFINLHSSIKEKGMCIPYNGKIWRVLYLANEPFEHIGVF